MDTELIIITDYISNSGIEPRFIILLEDEGLISTRWVEGQQYLYVSQLGDIEKYARWYYDLAINIEGIDTIRHLLNRMQQMHNELLRLRKMVGTNFDWDFDENDNI